MQEEARNDPRLPHACVSYRKILPPPNGWLQREVQAARMRPLIIKMEEGGRKR
jgi:hypothetical protein